MAETIYRQAPYIEERSEQLLASVFGDPNATRQQGETDEQFNLRRFGRAGVSRQVPRYEIAGYTDPQKAAFNLASQGIGQYAPFFTTSTRNITKRCRCNISRNSLFCTRCTDVRSRCFGCYG